MRLPSLTALRAFDAAAEHLSFKRAAEQLSVTPAALSFQIRQLEQELGCALFVRRSRRVSLSDEGALLQAEVRAGFEHFERALWRLRRHQQQRTLNISTGPSFSANWLAPRLYRFLAEQPQVDARISASLALADLHRDEVDVAIRFSSPRQPGCRVLKIADDYLTPLCSPALLRAGPPLREPADLARHTLIHSEGNNPAIRLDGWAQWLAQAGVAALDPDAKSLHFDVADHALSAAVSGAGVVLGREVLARRELEAGRLVQPFALRLQTAFSFYAVALEERAGEPVIAAFLRWLESELERPF